MGSYPPFGIHASHRNAKYFDLIENLENDLDIPQINKIFSQRQNKFNPNA